MPEFIPLARPTSTEAEIQAVVEVLQSGWWTTGPKVTQFEEAVCSYLGPGLHAVAVNSCTAGLFLVLKALGIGPGDQVIVPTWTFAATAHVVEWAGADVVLCDVQPQTLTIDHVHAQSLITEKTRAILPVHMAGYPCDLMPLFDLAAEHGLHVIEDAAHAMGTRYKGRNIGTWGHSAVFSFYSTKNLACGEGGMIVTPDARLAETTRRLSYFGIDKEAWRRDPEKDPWYYEIAELGYKFNMDSLHAAIGIVQLGRLEQMNEQRRQIAATYRRCLRGVGFFDDRPDHRHTYHLFMVMLPEACNRDRIIRELRQAGIGCGVHYIPLHLHPHYRCNGSGDFPVANAAYQRVLSLPLFPDMDDQQVQRVCETVNRIIGASNHACH